MPLISGPCCRRLETSWSSPKESLWATSAPTRCCKMAVERGFQVLGEAARRVTESFKAAHPEIPWSSIVGHRNVIVHDYADLSPQRIWEVVEEDLPGLAQSLERLISPEVV